MKTKIITITIEEEKDRNMKKTSIDIDGKMSKFTTESLVNKLLQGKKLDGVRLR